MTGQEFNMSLIARQFAAGILHHASEICAVTDQYVNSYKRLWGGAEALATFAGVIATVLHFCVCHNTSLVKAILAEWNSVR